MVIAVNLQFKGAFEWGIVGGVFKYVADKPDVRLWVPHAGIINQEPPDSVDGVIGLQYNLGLKGSPVPIVNVNSAPRGGDYQVCVNGDELCQMAIDHFRTCNIRQVCFLHDASCDVSFQRRAAFEERCRLSELFPHLLTTTLAKASRGLEHLTDALMALPKPAGILLFDDRFGPGMLSLCRDLRIRVPQEVAVLGVDNDVDICTGDRPGLTSIDIDPERIGYEAARVMMSAVKGKEVARVTLISPKEVVWRESTMARKGIAPDIANVLDYMHENLDQPLTMEDLVRQQSLGRRALEKGFKAELGEAPMHYLRSLRLQQVRYLLRTTKLKVSEIGKQCGFADLNYLCQLFRRLYKTTPLSFRKEHASEDR